MLWSSFLGTDVTERNKKSAVAKILLLHLPLRFSLVFRQVILQKSRSKVLTWSVGIEPIVKSMWNTMECKSDTFSGALGGGRETHWEWACETRSQCLSRSAETLLLNFSWKNHKKWNLWKKWFALEHIHTLFIKISNMYKGLPWMIKLVELQG